MINEKDVIRMKIPYPSIDDKLALSSHMYICKESSSPHFKYVKCQTFKPYMLTDSSFKHYLDEAPNVLRNPFSKTTRIDCDKLFTTDTVLYNDGLKTTIRPDICEDLFKDILKELAMDDTEYIAINENELEKINPLITSIP